MFVLPLLTAILMAGAAPSAGTSAGTWAGTGAGAATLRPATVVAKPMATSISKALAASPATITFTAPDPDTTPSVSGSGPVTLSWDTNGGGPANTWKLTVSAPASFSTCANLPASAVTAKCTTVTGGTGGTCSGSVPLSTTATQVASGDEAPGNNAAYSVALTFTLADSWAYIPSKTSCSLTLTYTVTAN